MAEQHPSTYYKTPFLFTGKEKDDYTGLHYFGARYYDSRTSIWLSVDPLAESFPNWNPYNYTMQNPINMIDPDGRAAYKPSPLEAALMAKHVYGDKVDLQGGWKVSSAGKGLPFVNKSGLKSALYERTVNGKTEYIYATAGTENGQDWKNNASQLVGASKQYKESKSNAEALKERLGDAELTFTGHSLGGGLAEGNAITTGDSAITFNAAGVGVFTSGLNNESNTDAYIMTTDPLNTIQQAGGPFVPTAGGDKHWLQPRNASGVYNGHSINSVIDALSKPTVLQKIWNTVKQAITPPSFTPRF